MFRSLLFAARAGVAAMRANPVRALLATLGVVIGSGALVSVLAVSDGVESYARAQVRERGFDRVVIRPITDESIDGQSVPRADTARLGVAELVSLGGALADGERASLRVEGAVPVELGAPPRRRALRVRGVARLAADTQALLAGRHMTAEESRAGAPVAVVSVPLARVLLGDTSGAPGTGALDAASATRIVGDSLPLAGTWVRVIGVASDGAVVVPGTPPLAVDVPFAVAREALAGVRSGAALPSLVAITDRAETARAMRVRVEAWLAARGPTWREQLRINARPESQLEDVRRGMLIFRLLMGSITGITLIVGGIGIMNVLLASVAERTREIGVRRAVGARRRDILFQFLAESITITVIGAAIGTVVGLGTAYAVTAVMRSQTNAVIHAATTLQTVLLSASVAVLVGFVFGCYPAARAARLAPIDAIHTE